jgi:hypothetical protein
VVTEDVSKRPALEDRTEGVDADYDPDEYSNVRLNGRPEKRNGEPGTGGSQAKSGRADADVDTPQLGILTRFRNFLFRK